ncbi:ricin-type beta-trefoil lectin domain protein [Kitasatospora sp. NPDC058032]|uniref:ricin-type beta-trefoil lectin domain protein n=1 Tax=Kitasatospora sp. NPDC058032 TaxID=3346307 RepID=UPI0036DA68EF
MRRTAALLSSAALLGAAASLAAPATGAQALAGGCGASVAGWSAYGTCSGIDPLQTWYVSATCQWWNAQHTVQFSRGTFSGVVVGDGSAVAPCGVNETVSFPYIVFGAKLPPQPAGPVGQITGYAGKCVDVKGASSNDGTPVQIYDCNGTNAQQWKIGADGTIRDFLKCMDVSGGGTANGTKVQLYTCNGSGAQQWQVRADGSIYNPQSGRCLDDLGFSTANGNQLGIWDCNGAENQVWHVPA